MSSVEYTAEDQDGVPNFMIRRDKEIPIYMKVYKDFYGL